MPSDRTLEQMAALGGVSALGDKGAHLPERPFTATLTIPLNASGESALLILPKGVTKRELRNVVRYVNELLIPNLRPEVPVAE